MRYDGHRSKSYAFIAPKTDPLFNDTGVLYITMGVVIKRMRVGIAKTTIESNT